MKLPDIGYWWRGLPRRTRIRLIASVLLVFAGTEVLLIAPQVFELAVMIDMMGSAFLIAALFASFQVPLLQLRTLLASIGNRVALFAQYLSSVASQSWPAFVHMILRGAGPGSACFRANLAWVTIALFCVSVVRRLWIQS